jgi:peptidoglycan/LPS O-acetylase OafA/YrhL
VPGTETAVRSAAAAARAQVPAGAPGAPAPAPGARSAGFNASINGLRGVCALLVFVYHVANSRIVPLPSGSAVADAFSYLVSSARYGVEMFFMISGFVIVASVRRHATVQGFLADRAARIFALWLPVCAVLWVGRCLLSLPEPVDTSGLDRYSFGLANLLLLPPLLPLETLHPASWSLSYEWLFYFVAGGCALAWRAGHRRAAQLLAVAAFAAGFVLIPRSVFFLVGVVVVIAGPERAVRWQPLLRAPWLSLLAFLCLWRYTQVDDAAPGLAALGWLVDLRGPAAVGALVCGLHFFAALTWVPAHFRFLRTRVCQWLGDISFSFYLVHPLVMAVVKRLTTGALDGAAPPGVQLAVFCVVSLALALPMSHLSRELFEVRATRWLKHGGRPRPATAS